MKHVSLSAFFRLWRGVLLLLGPAGAALAQPTITALNPARNAKAAPVATTVAVTFNQPVTNGANIRIFSQQYRGRRTATTATSGTTVTLTPTASSGSASFRAGEVVSVTVPTTVTSIGGRGAAQQVYQFTAAASGGPAVFTNGTSPSVNATGENAVLADVDNDGDLDMLIPRIDGASVGVLLNTGSGVFGSPTDLATPEGVASVAPADIDRDGDLDLLIGRTSGNVSIGLNNGSGTFTLTSYAVTTQLKAIVMADVDADGDPDMLVLNNTTATVQIRFNNGSGTFSGTGSVAVGTNPQELTVADVDNDGALDLLTANSATAGTVSVRLNNGSGTFSGTTSVSVGNNPQSLTVADIDNDGDLDLLTANTNAAGTVSIRLNAGGAFSGTTSVSVGNAPYSITTADVDGDGDLDFLTANSGDNTASIRVNNGTGIFSVPSVAANGTVAVGATPYSVATGDLNGDGAIDLVTANHTDVSVTVRLNQITPTITSFAATSGPVGVTVTVTGTNFTGATALTLNGTAVTGYTVVNATTITFTVPAGATSGPIGVTTPNGTVTSTASFTVTPPPTLTTLAPSAGPVGTVVTLTGTGFQPGSTVSFNGTAATVVTVNSLTSITATVPTGTTTGTVTVSNENGTTNGVLYTIAARPLVTALSPTRNARATATTTAVAVTFDQPVLNGGNIKVFSARYRGQRTATASTSGNTVTLTPTTPSGGSQTTGLTPGETVLVTAPATVTGTTGAQAVPQVYQFTAAAGAGPGIFSPGSTVAVGASPYNVALADIDNDGDLDLLTVSNTSASVSIRFNDGTGTYSGTTSVSVGSSTYAIAMADVDGDGDLDILTTNQVSAAGTVSVRFNNGTGAFSGGSNVSVGSNPQMLCLADLDADGDLDLVCANSSSNNVSVRFNNGTGSFSGTGSVAAGTGAIGVTAADVDNDGDMDLLVANVSASTVSVLLNNGSATFTSGTAVSVGTNPTAVAAGDIDGDGDLDILTTNFNGTVSVRFNDGTGTFTGTTDVPVAGQLRSLSLGDIDGDGDLDAVTANGTTATTGTVGVLTNNGTGVFALASTATAGTNPYSVALGDLDGDNDLDFVVSNFGSANVSVRFNQYSLPTITSFTPTNGPVGTSVTVTGTNFVGISTLTLNGQAVTGYTVVNPTTITFTVPSGATSGQIAVTNPRGTAISTGSYTVTVPTITSFTPTSGPAGTVVTVTGTLFTGATGVNLNGTPATNYTVVDANTITFTVPLGATSGPITVTTPVAGTATSTNSYTVVVPAPPTLTVIAPSGGPIGTVVSLTGTNFIGTLSVDFNGTTATAVTVNSPTSITVTVPVGATTGNVTVTTSGGTTNGLLYSVAPRPVITALSPARNTNTAATNSAVAVTFDQPVLNGSSIKLFSTQYRGQRTATVSTSGNTVTLTPTTPSGGSQTAGFKPGETVLVTVPAAITGTTGAVAFRQVYQFTAAAGVGPGTFSGTTNTPVGQLIKSVTTADLDNDGDLDFLAADQTTNVVSVRFNDGSGTFSGTTSVGVGSGPQVVVTADVDGDGDLDLLTANNSGSVSVRFNDGTGSFSGSTDVSVTGTVSALAVGDMEGDGDLDFLVTNAAGGFQIYFNNGSGSFGSPVTIAGGTSYPTTGLAVGDVDGDGDLDVAMSDNIGAGTVRLNNGDATFGGMTYTGFTTATTSITLGDLDGDGDLDLVAACTDGKVNLRINNGGGTMDNFLNANITPTFAALQRVVLGDIDGDGDLDILASSDNNLVGILTNDGNFTFNATSYGIGNATYGITVGDLDGDGDLDLLTGNASLGTVSIRFNQAPAPTITSFTPTTATVGTTVTVTGTYFTGATVVQVNGLPVTTYTVVSGTSITFTVPAGATTGQVSVTTPGGTATSTGNLTITSPAITSFSPTSGPVGTLVTVTGTNLTGATALTLNGIAVTGYTVVNATTITFTVPSGATSGPIAVTTPGGTATSTSSYIYIGTGAQVTGLSPTSGPVGTTVTVTGINFFGVSAITLNGVAVTGFAVNSPTSITFTVPSGATTGTVAVTTPSGTATGPTYTVTTPSAPDLTVSTPQTIPAGTYNTITVTGTGTGTVGGPITVLTGLTVQPGGTLDTNCQPLTGVGAFTLAGGATIYICDVAGISPTGTSAGAVQVSGTRIYSPDGTYVYTGTAAQITGTGLPAAVRSLRSTNANTVTLTAPVAVAQELSLTAGDLALNGQALTLRSSASGTALVINTGAGVVTGGTATVQRYLTTTNAGLGYRHYSSPVSGNTLSDLQTSTFTPVFNSTYNTSLTPGLVTPFPTVEAYDQSRLALAITSYGDFDKGWYSPCTGPGNTPDAFVAGQGYAVNLRGTELVDFTGTLHTGNYPLTLACGPQADAGWQLVGNPYPAPIDWAQVVAENALTNLDASMYVFESSAQYSGSYRSYVNGIGNPLIGSGQGFFVRVSQGQTSGSLSFHNSQRKTSFADQVPMKRGAADTRPQLHLTLNGAGHTDDLYVYAEAGATAGLDARYDAAKLANPSGLNLAAMASTGEELAIAGLPTFAAGTTVPLRLNAPAAGSYTLVVAALNNLPVGLTAYLRDAMSGQQIRLSAQNITALTLAAGLNTRYSLLFAPAGALATATTLTAAQVVLYPNPVSAGREVTVALPVPAGSGPVTTTLFNSLGQAVATARLSVQAGQATGTLPTVGLAAGVYTLRLQVAGTTLTKRVLVN